MALSWPQRIADRSVLWSVAAVAVIYLVTLTVMPRHGLWIVDNENRFLQVQALVENDFAEYAIRWPGHAIDPAFAYNPLRFNPEGSFEELKDGQLISVFQPAFIVIAAVFYRLLGFWGLYILPLGAAILLLIGVVRLAVAMSLDRPTAHLAVLLTGFATPVWFYSQTFWEHTTAACLCVWGVCFVMRFITDRARWQLAAGFALLVAAVFFRDVLGLFALVLLGWLLWRVQRQRLRVVLTAGAVLLAGLGLLMLLQWLTIGKPLGFHAGTLLGSGAGLVEHLQDRPRLFWLFFFAAHADRVWSLLLTAPFVIAFLWRPRLTETRLGRAVPLWSLAALVTGAIFLVFFVTAPNVLRHLLAANGFFLAAPVLILGLLRGAKREPGHDSGHHSEHDSEREPFAKTDFLLAVACTYLLVYCLVAPWAGAVSLHWGARPVFVLYPLFAVLAAATLARWWQIAGTRRGWQAAVIGLLLLTSCVAQIESVRTLARKKAFSERLNRTVAGISQPIIVTNVWWLGHELYSVFFDRPIFYLRTQAELEQLAATLHTRGVREFVLATRPQQGPKPPSVLRVDDGGWNFYSLDFVIVPVGPAEDAGPAPGRR